jgi:3D (Asp-Asp-Asp) domain-containing protein
MILSGSAARKAAVTLASALAFVALYEVTMIDSERAAREASLREETAEPAPGAHLIFWATAYCKGQVTASGVPPRSGVAAADPALLPVGSVVQVGTAGEKYAGIYTIMDTGPAVQGREIDIYMWSCYEALAFGRQRVHLTVLRLGWNPQQTSPTFVEVLFPNRSARPARPSRPVLPSHAIKPASPVELPATLPAPRAPAAEAPR